jgi:putative membrane protein
VTDNAEKDPRVYFAAERTFLAWIRTGLGLIGVGFAVSRFGLFLREFAARQTQTKISASIHSVISGVVLVVLGVIVLVAATFRHVQVTRELASGRWVPGQVSRDAVVLAILLAVAGVLLAGYLIFVR